ncbi:hypothetical protein FHW83_004278 [Duganella sp. SG902]|uniref:hypothetical protein n=1 Tax=Duganella sp. SG902 TaxID=2587016 RepID=UPI00159D4676|nr:hypothetical protein [Duganella sp. SG902]NVM78450.1 hypothetical protein [Duganella sp. SG902]
MDAYFDYCRDRALKGGHSHSEIVGYVSCVFEGGFERSIENLMWDVVVLVISGGWYFDWDAKLRENIANRIRADGLDNILAGVPNDEVDVFVRDLKLVGLI